MQASDCPSSSRPSSLHTLTVLDCLRIYGDSNLRITDICRILDVEDRFSIIEELHRLLDRGWATERTNGVWDISSAGRVECDTRYAERTRAMRQGGVASLEGVGGEVVS